MSSSNDGDGSSNQPTPMESSSDPSLDATEKWRLKIKTPSLERELEIDENANVKTVSEVSGPALSTV